MCAVLCRGRTLLGRSTARCRRKTQLFSLVHDLLLVAQQNPAFSLGCKISQREKSPPKVKKKGLFSRFRVDSVPQVPGTTLTCFSSAIRHVLLRVRRQGCTATISLTTRSVPNSLSGRWHQHRFSCRTILHPYVAPHRRTYTQQSSCERVHHRFIIVPPPSLFHTIPLSFVLSCVSPWCASVVRTNTYGFFLLHIEANS